MDLSVEDGADRPGVVRFGLRTTGSTVGRPEKRRSLLVIGREGEGKSQSYLCGLEEPPPEQHGVVRVLDTGFPAHLQRMCRPRWLN